MGRSPRGACREPECGRAHKALGWCAKHYGRFKRNGDPNLTRPRSAPLPILDRLADKILVGDGCWEWTASKDRNGYGKFGSRRSAHVVVYELLVGPVPEGLELDHSCRNRGCVRPAHLEPVTHAENQARGLAAKTSCINGHPLAGDNLLLVPKGRRCRECKSAAYKRWKTNLKNKSVGAKEIR